jgi:hypothetical protein
LGTFNKLKSGDWRVQVRRKGCYLTETFRRHADGDGWAIATERRIDRGESPKKRARIDPTTFGHLIDLHIDDLKDVGKAPRRSAVPTASVKPWSDLPPLRSTAFMVHSLDPGDDPLGCDGVEDRGPLRPCLSRRAILTK